MGESLKGYEVRKYETTPRTTPYHAAKGRRGYDHCAVFVSSFRVGGDARSLNKALGSSAHRPVRAGITSHTPAGSDFDIGELCIESISSLQ